MQKLCFNCLCTGTYPGISIYMLFKSLILAFWISCRKRCMRLVKSFWYYVAIDLYCATVSHRHWIPNIACQPKKFFHTIASTEGELGYFLYTTRHLIWMLFTQIGEKIWVSMPYISDFAYMQVSKKHLSAAFPLKVKF